MHRRLSPITVLLLVTLFKGQLTSMIVPLWEFPDEQAHFAQVSHYVESGLTLGKNDLSQEIYISEQIMGTLRNQRGENKYTYHPEYKPPYSTTLIGPNENYLRNLDHKTRTTYVKKEAAHYHPLYYLLTSLGYRLTYPQDLLSRAFATRAASILFSPVSIYLCYRIGLILFNKSKFYALALASLLSFHPMFSFLSSGINNDNLVNLFALVLIYQSLLVVKSGVNSKLSLAIIATSLLGLLTKPLIVPVIIVTAFAVFYDWYRSKRPLSQQVSLTWPLVLAIIIALAFSSQRWLNSRALPFFPTPTTIGASNPITLLDYSISQLSRYYRETLVWYWGVFKWLGVVFPLDVLRAIKLVLATSLLGLFKLFLIKKPFVARTNLILLTTFTVTFIVALTIWDYSIFKNAGFSHGIQGRYFFPTIAAHLGLLLAGFIALFPRKFRSYAAKTVVLAMVSLHSLSLYILLNSYYHTGNLATLLTQTSQYKPSYFKYPLNIFWAGIYVLLLVIFLRAFLLAKEKSTKLP